MSVKDVILFLQKRVPYEIEILWRLRDVSGVITILEHFEEANLFILIMEKVPNSCTLFNLVMENASLSNTDILRHIFREIIHINITLQTFGVWHRDCKPENILYCKNDHSLRFIDFGSAAPVQPEDFHEFQVRFIETILSFMFILFTFLSSISGYLRNHGTRMDTSTTL